MKTQIILLLVVAIALLQTACTEPVEEIDNITITEKSQKLVEADNAFGLDLFQLIFNDEETPTNFMISPLSISMALSMAYNGAETETRDEMADAMRVQDFRREDVNQIYLDLTKALTGNDREVAMEIANSIWYRNTYNVEQNFLDVNHTYYNAEVNAANFNDPATVDLRYQSGSCHHNWL